MSAQTLETRKLDANQTLVFMLIAGGIVLFTTFTASYLVRRESADWARTALPGVMGWNTALIAASSVTMELARRRKSEPWMEATLTLAVLFGFGQSMAWLQLRERGAYLASNPHASFFYVLTAVHAFHLAAGLATLAWAIPRARTAQLGLVAAWWHFVGLAWVWIAILLAFF